MKVKPLFDRVVLKQQNESPKTVGGLVLPDSSQEKPLIAEVIAVGPGAEVEGKLTKMVVGVGDRVIYSKYAGSIFKLENEEVTIIRQTDILAKLEK